MASPHDLAVCIKDAQGRFKIRVKVTPGSKRTKITGLLGDRLKIAVTAPPEAGRANHAVSTLIAQTLGLPPRDVRITRGRNSPMKTIEVEGMTICDAVERLARAMQ